MLLQVLSQVLSVVVSIPLEIVPTMGLVHHHHHHLRRATERFLTVNGTSPDASSHTDSSQNATFDPVLFWSVNAFIIIVTAVVCLYCCYGNTSWFTNIEQRRRLADAEYQATLREREERRKQAKIMSPEKRRRLLLASFRRHRVSMVCVLCLLDNGVLLLALI